MKLHRHALSCDGHNYTVITLRPGAYARFSNNYYHETWHVLSDWHGARVLGRLLWGLAYQRMPGTLVLIDRPNLDPSPFSGEPADLIALVPSRLTSLSERAARDLRARLPLTRPAGTVRWQTHGLDQAIAAGRRSAAPWRNQPGDSRIGRSGGLITFAATPDILREWAVDAYRAGEHAFAGMDYVFFNGQCRWAEGELQIFRDYRRRVTSATQARREILASIPRQVPRSDADPLIWQRAAAIRRRSLPARSEHKSLLP